MIWLGFKTSTIQPALNSLRRTFSQQQQRIDIQPDLHQQQIYWRIVGSIVSLTVFVILLLATLVGIPVILTKVKKSNCPERGWPELPPPRDPVPLCTARASWNSTGITVAGLASGLPSTSLAGLQYPNDVYVYDNGTVLVADYANDRITKWDPGVTVGVLIAGTGSYGSWSTLLARPMALDVRSDQLYVSDSENYRIQMFPLDTNSSSPEAVTLFGRYGRGSDINQVNQITSLIAPTSDSSLLYMTDSKNHRILQWNSELNYITVVAGKSGIFGSNSTLLYNPLGITLNDTTNSLYIADSNNNRIQKYNLSMQNLGITVAGWGQLNNPHAVQLDPSGINMFIADTLNHRILVWLDGDLQGRIIAGSGIAGNSNTQLNNPTQIRFDFNYNLYVVDTNNSRIQRFDLLSNGC